MKKFFPLIFSFIFILAILLSFTSCVGEGGEYSISFETGTSQGTIKKSFKDKESFEMPADPKKDGYSFLGWYIGEDKWSPDKISSDLTVTARWEIISYNINYDLDGGKFDNEPLCSYDVESAYTVPSPTKDGFIFAGWTTNENDTPDTNYTIQKGSTGDISIKANWLLPKNKIYYNLAGGSFSGSYETEFDELVSLQIPTPQKSGYKFLGWTTESETTPNPNYTIKAGTKTDVSLIANWEIITYFISYNLDGGSFSSEYKTEFTVESNVAIPIPQKPGYEFLGWVGENDSEPNASFNISSGTAGNVAITAKWKPIVYTITYILNSGTMPSSYETTYTVESSFVVSNPTRKGHVFDGWSSATNLTPNDKYSITPGSIGNIILYANWSLNKYTITYSLAGGTNSANNAAEFNIGQSIVIYPPTKAGMNFVGWKISCSHNLDSNSDNLCDQCRFQFIEINSSNQTSLPSTLDRNIILTAKWECTGHVDLNTDNYCDYCNQALMPSDGSNECTEHEDEDVDGECDNCGEPVEPDNTECTDHEDEDEDGECDNCGEPIVPDTTECTEHEDEDEDGECDNCGEDVGSDDSIYYWDNVELIIKMTHNDNYSLLSSGCERYLAGEYNGIENFIDEAVFQRNAAAMEHAKISLIRYSYFDNTDEYAWGYVYDDITRETSSNDTHDQPDIYVNFVYDMVLASLNGSFANLYGTIRGQGKNYFPFAVENYDESVNDGYMYEYMNSLTLSNTKMYILASDYFIDLVRAFYVIPFNVDMLERVGMNVTGDIDGKGDGFTVDDFYYEVMTGGWTYNKLEAYSAEVYNDDQNVGRVDISDTLGFALATDGLSSSAMIYTAPFSIINKTWNDATGGYEYTYPDTNDALCELFVNIYNLFDNKRGIIVAENSSDILSYGGNPASAIRARFGDNKLLFGGIILLGALEYETYQQVKEEYGLGVVPIPLYKQDSEARCLTQINNVGSAGAISNKSMKFEQCTAYLNYQSQNSSDILDDYYDYYIQYDVADGSAGAVTMLQYIRSNVRTSFDMMFEDVLYAYYENRSWRSMLVNGKYKVDIRENYSTYVASKQQDLKDLINMYESLPS